ncbi:MAG TPA: ABC transporter ATP-binding protein [Candidatus Bathyarchaeia archaeon]|nr:ABC transporter ATP-binding protein [Candidatus Bathyarchaeia archaeon]
MIRQALEDLRPYLWPITVILALSLSAVPITLITPLPIKILVDNVLGSSPLPGYLAIFYPTLLPSRNYAIWLAVSILVGVAALSYLQNLANVWYSNKIGNRMTLGVRSLLFRQMQHLSIAYHDKMGAADSAYRTLNDAPMLRSFGIDGVIPLTTSILTLAAMILVMVYLDWQLALIALLVSPFLFMLTVVFRPKIRSGWRKYRASESAAMAVAQESLSASRLVKAYGQEGRKSEQLVSHYSESLDAQLQVQVYSAFYSLLVGILTAAGLAAVLFIGIQHVQARTLSLGSLLVVNFYVTQLYGPLRGIGSSILDVQQSLTGIERYHTILDEKPDVPEAPNARPLARAQGKIVFNNVTFEYEKEHPVLHNVSFRIQAGDSLGVIGPTGSGKTTISTLLLRLFDPTTGTITLDDVDLRDYRVADLRNQFAVVHQETVLFSTSVAENIRFANPNASMEQVIGAAKAARAHDFIIGLPDGYETLVGERGMKLSGGERQRISLARAFLKDPAILILDEPTSSLDLQTESEILATIQQLTKGRTTLMIAHRASTLRNCNVILSIDNGRVGRVTSDVETVLANMTRLPEAV